MIGSMDRIICSGLVILSTIVYATVNWVSNNVPKDITIVYVLLILVLFIFAHAYNRSRSDG